jgi:hypothetical protein
MIPESDNDKFAIINASQKYLGATIVSTDDVIRDEMMRGRIEEYSKRFIDPYINLYAKVNVTRRGLI